MILSFVNTDYDIIKLLQEFMNCLYIFTKSFYSLQIKRDFNKTHKILKYFYIYCKHLRSFE